MFPAPETIGKILVVAPTPKRYGRGGQGVIGMQTSERNGAVVGAVQVSENDEIMLISDKGTLVRTRVEEVSVQGRNTQGVRLIRLKEGEKLVGLEQVDEPNDEDLQLGIIIFKLLRELLAQIQ